LRFGRGRDCVLFAVGAPENVNAFEPSEEGRALYWQMRGILMSCDVPRLLRRS
jgi:hypothetical protein